MNLKELKQLWQEHDFHAKKRLGQNFLIDNNVRDNILDALSVEKDSVVVEIGAGFGAMTFGLADRCGKLFAVEKDRRTCAIMRPFFEERKNITLVNADILKTELSALTGRRRHITVFGNIPYYISTPIIEKMIEQKRCIDSLYIVMQEELVNRIISPPGPKEYGSLSCFVQFHAEPKKLFKIKKNSFYPKPKVGSCLLKLKMLRTPSVRVRDEGLMFRIIRKAFSQRRKKAVNPLSESEFSPINREEWKKILEACGIDASSRAENLSLLDYAHLADAVLPHFKT